MKALVPTCNRPESFARLVLKLQYFEVIGFINNSTEENILKYRNLSLPENVRLIFTDIYGNPKKCHVEIFRYMLQLASNGCLVLEDDVIPCESFYNEINLRIQAIEGVQANFTLSPIYLPDRNSDFYTGGESKPVNIRSYQFIDQAWVDGNFYMTAGVLAEMKKWLSLPVKSYKASSGIGRKNSAEIYKRGWKMYTSVPTLVEHLDEESVMFGDRRKQVPLIARFNQ